MPVDRFIHPRLGHSDKVNRLTDFEARVWFQYLLSADDFGIMSCSAAPLQADNDALDKRPRAMVQRALESVLETGLLREFEHQGRRYVFQHDWQTWQKVRYPRDSSNPCPPEASLQECDGETLELFRNHHRNFPETFTPRACASAQAGAKRLPANGNRPTATGLRSTFSEFWAAYPRKVGKEPSWAVWQRLRPDAGLLETILAAVERHKRSEQWTEQGGKFIPYPKTWLGQQRWTDELATVPEAKDYEWTCPHEPACLARGACATRTAIEAGRKKAS